MSQPEEHCALCGFVFPRYGAMTFEQSQNVLLEHFNEAHPPTDGEGGYIRIVRDLRTGAVGFETGKWLI